MTNEKVQPLKCNKWEKWEGKKEMKKEEDNFPLKI